MAGAEARRRAGAESRAADDPQYGQPEVSLANSYACACVLVKSESELVEMLAWWQVSRRVSNGGPSANVIGLVNRTQKVSRQRDLLPFLPKGTCVMYTTLHF